MLIGLVGLPNSGKSTFLKALTLKDVSIASYPFTTIKPNEAVGHVTTECPCKKVDVICNPQNSKCIDGIRYVPVRLLDVAGLVPGAHLGRGLGNQFLDDLRHASGLIHVLDCSGKTNAEGKSVEDYDPEKNIQILEEEIDQWIFGIVKKNYEKIERVSKTEKKPLERLLAQQLSGLGVSEENVKNALKIAEPESIEFSKTLRKISKPILIAANKIDLESSQKNFEKLKNKYDIIPCSAESELALREAEIHSLIEYKTGSSGFKITGSINEKQKDALEFIKTNILDKYGSTGIQKILNRVVFDLLEMVAVYPVANITRLSDTKNNVLPDAFLLKKGTKLKEFAEEIHKEIAENFISGLNTEKKKIGADYELKNGDIVEILFKK